MPKEKILRQELHTRISEKDIVTLNRKFEEIETRTKLGLTFTNFKNVLRSTIGSMLPETELRFIFNEIDVNFSGYILWEDFISYILSKMWNRDKVSTLPGEHALRESFHTIQKSIYQQPICRVSKMSFLALQSETVDFNRYQYVTMSKDSCVTFWNENWNLLKYKNLNTPMYAEQKVFPWALDMICLPNVNLIGVSSTDDTIKFYDVVSTNFELVITLCDLDATVCCMDYWFDEASLQKAILFLGDIAGCITVMNFQNCIENKLFGPSPEKNISMKYLQSGQRKCVAMKRLVAVHDYWVIKVYFIAQLKSIVSCSNSSDKSLVVCILNQDLEVTQLRRIFRVGHGFSCFDYDEKLNAIATGGIDRCVRLWNPYITEKSLTTFIGHNSPVDHVMIAGDVEQIFSVSSNKYLKVWDLKNNTCIQTLSLRAAVSISQPITAVYHNKKRRAIVIAAVTILVIDRICKAEIGSDSATFLSHPQPLSGIVFSSSRNQIISTCHQGVILFWNLETGQRAIEISEAHSDIADGVEVGRPITALCLDETGQRLLTAGLDGLLKMWGVSNGTLLKTIKIPFQHEITSIIVYGQNVYFAGWSKQVFSCNVNFDVESVRMWPKCHIEDIQAMALLAPKSLVTGSWDGTLRVWLVGSGFPKTTMSMHQFVRQYNLHVSSSAMVIPKQVIPSSSESMFDADQKLSRKIPRPPKTPKPVSMHSTINKKRWQSFGDSTSLSKLASIEMAVNAELRDSKIRLGLPDNRDSALPKKRDYQLPIMCVQILATRTPRPGVGDLFAADISGRIQVWSTESPGTLLAVFASVTTDCHYTSCIITDSQNKYLITGDSIGFVRVWYIRFYFSAQYSKRMSVNTSVHPDTNKFPFAQPKLKLIANKLRHQLSAVQPIEFYGFVAIAHPLLLSTYRAHLKLIVQIILIEEQELLVTASTDQTIRLWGLHGRFLGIFGDPTGWSLSKLLTAKPEDRKIPNDIRKVATATTFQVLRSGLSSRWSKIRLLFLKTYILALLKKMLCLALEEYAKRLLELLKTKTITISQLPKLLPVEITSAGQLAHDKTKSPFDHGPPLGKQFRFAPTYEKLQSLPSISAGQNAMNAVYAYLRVQQLESFVNYSSHSFVNSYPFLRRSRMHHSKGSSRITIRSNLSGDTGGLLPAIRKDLKKKRSVRSKQIT